MILKHIDVTFCLGGQAHHSLCIGIGMGGVGVINQLQRPGRSRRTHRARISLHDVIIASGIAPHSGFAPWIGADLLVILRHRGGTIAGGGDGLCVGGEAAPGHRGGGSGPASPGSARGFSSEGGFQELLFSAKFCFQAIDRALASGGWVLLLLGPDPIKHDLPTSHISI